MIALVQRVRQARVEVAGASIGEIGPGLLVLVCAEPADTEAVALVARNDPNEQESVRPYHPTPAA